MFFDPRLRGLNYAATAGGPGLSAEVAQFFDRLTTLPSASDQALYIALIDGLVADGLWTKLDALCVPAPDPATALTNLVQNSYGASYVSSPTFTANRGFTPNGTTSYINIGLNPSSINGVGKFAQNSAFIGGWNLTAQTNSGSALIRSAANVSLEIYPKYTNNNTLSMVNNSGSVENQAANSGDTSGFYVATRTASNVLATYRNGSSLGTFATASTTPENNAVYAGYGVALAANWVIACWCFGSGLTAGNVSSLYTRLATYMTAKGAI